MSLSQFATRNIKGILFVVGALCLAGIAAYRTFPVSILPDVTFPRVVVIANAGERPTKMIDASLTRPLEDALTTVAGVKRIVSRTKRGELEISIDFDWGVDVLQAEQQVNAKVNEIRSTLPPETQTSVERMNPTVFPVLGLTLDSKDLSPSQLYDLATYTLKPRLSRVDGVARVVVQGGLEPEVEVVCDPAKLASLKIPITDVTTAISASNTVASVGRVNDKFQQFQILVDGIASDVDGLKSLNVGSKNGSPILLRDVATVALATADRQTVVSANGQECVLLNIVRQPSANSVAMASAVKDEVVRLQKQLPKGATIGTFYDQSLLVKDAIQSVGEAVLIGGVLAVVVLLLFLGDLRATAVTAAIIPLTVLITFLLMRLAGLTLNLMTLGSLAVGIGLVIDDAIVVVENVFKHLGHDNDIAKAVKAASGEIARPMISSTLTTVVVFLPLSLLQGVAGAFFSALAITLTIALLVSLVLALFVSPALCSAFLTAASHRGERKFFLRLLDRYERVLRWSFHHKPVIGLCAIGLLVATYLIGTKLPTGFMPNMDEGAFVLDYFTPAGSSLEESDRLLKQVDSILLSTPEVATFSRRTGTELGFSITEGNRGDYAVMLKQDRHRKIDDVISDIRGKIQAQVPGVDVDFGQVLQDLIGDLSGNPRPVEIKLFGTDQTTLNDLATQLAGKMGTVKGFADVQSGVVQAGPETSLMLNQAEVGHYGLAISAVEDQATAALYGTVASNFLTKGREIPVRVRYPASFRSNLDSLNAISIMSPSGAMIPFGALGQFVTVPGSTEMGRENQRLYVDLTCGLEGVDISTAIKNFKKIQSSVQMPPGVTIEFGGQYQSQAESFSNLIEVLAGAILLVYAVMLFQFGGFSAPTTIILVMPLGLFGAVLALLLTGIQLNVSSFMGAIMLVGIVVKNGILLLDRAQESQAAGLAQEDALIDAGRQRLRPILMTSLTAILGLIPLALGLGAGAEMQQPLAVTVIGGLTFSTLTTLIFAPTFYTIVHRTNRLPVRFESAPPSSAFD